MKNQRRWTFGGVYPRGWSERHPDDRWRVRTEVLLEGEPVVEVTVRFLHVVRVDGDWDEAVERELSAPARVALAAGEDRQERPEAAVTRSWEALEGAVE